jgi:DNA-binding NarL/FixJ family response regulator
VDGALLPALARHAAALAARDAGLLEAAGQELEGLGLELDAAEALAAAATAHAAAGRRGPARRATAESARLARDCEGARTPALAALAPSASRAGALTRRELEVATLAARGLANEQIADRLVVSVRTVESHLYRAFAKLGIGGREELGPLMLESPRTRAAT